MEVYPSQVFLYVKFNMTSSLTKVYSAWFIWITFVILFIAWKHQSLKKHKNKFSSFVFSRRRKDKKKKKKHEGEKMGFNFGWTTPLTPLLIQCRQNSWKKVNSIPYIKHWGSFSRWPAVLSFARELGGGRGQAQARLFSHLLCGSRYGDKKTVNGWFVLACWAEIDCEKAQGTKD